ncbi:high mobility group nucleosome-binding domain-containing protein 5-like [Macrobrachium nipponense]|uniref:high mobility group nucleosome-binding domain-containing protein 5-like n=1 Tax=Macrobrachium nipponense TaxID=159736 RepID=UPI0030C875EB
MPRRVDRLRKEARISRTPSDLLSDLHVYILPQDKWIPFRRLARNTVVEETVSAGFVRVLPDVTLVDLRQELTGQLGDDVPEHYVFIKSVGRNFTQVKPHQEQMVKAKNFLPPHAEEPEIHIMELSEELLRYAPSLSNLLASDTELSESFGPSRLTQRETYARAENLRSWAENAEGKWEGPSSDVNGDSLSAPGIKATDRYNLDSNIIIHWQSQEDGEEEREADETRDRGDGMSDNRERRRSIEGDDEGASEEGSSNTSEEEDQEARAARRNRRNREKRGGGGGGGDRRKAKNGVAGGRTGANENRRGNVGGKDDNADNDDDGDEDGKSEGEGKRKAETESDEKGMDERSEETGDEGGKKRANKALHKTNSKSQLKKRHKGNRKGAAADGNSEEHSEDDDDEETTDKTKKPKDSKARHVTGRGGGARATKATSRRRERMKGEEEKEEEEGLTLEP